MSHYTSIALEIRDRDALVAALADLGLTVVEVHNQPQHLFGYEADVRPEKAEDAPNISDPQDSASRTP